MNLLVFAALFFPVMLSGLSVFLFKTSNRNLKLLLAFSGAFLLSLSFLEILPEIYTSKNAANIGIFILIGFFIQLLLDFLTKGVEHGHEHVHCECKDMHHEHTKISPIPILIGVCIHSFIEGMPLAENFHIPALKNTLLIGIVIHNIPISLVLISLLIQTKVNKLKSIILLSIFALAAPIGTLTSYFVGMSYVSNLNDFFDIIMALVVGIFLHISTTILFETEENHKFNMVKFIAIIAGASIPLIHL
jgi:zinc transporter ZupT